jgi:hypothetical protein
MAAVDELPALFALIEEMRYSGMTEPEIAGYLEALDREAFDQACDEMRAAGVPEQRIEAFWIEVATFGDTESADAYDSDDERTD